MSNNRIFSSLFWRISAIFLLVLLVFAGITLKVAVDAARNYSLEANQKLNLDLAEHTVKEIKPFLEGNVKEESIGTLIHSMMAINPSVEVYVLDPKGTILKHVAFEGVVKLKSVSLEPVLAFLEGPKEGLLIGDDPRNPGEQRIFSAAAVNDDNDELQGYVYIILAGQEYAGVTDMLFNSYFLQLSGRTILVALLLTLVAGLIAIFLITKNLNRIVSGFRRFQSGDLTSRIEMRGGGELQQVAGTFNEMAATIEQNIEEMKGLDKLRKELIGNVSHDLRTPISSIQGYAETLLMKGADLSEEEQSKYLNIIVSGTQRLKLLVNDLFELSKLEAQQVKLDLEPLRLGELVHDVVNKQKLQATEKGITIHTILAKDLPIVEVDVQKIDRVLQNLLDNAINFCRKGDTINIELDAAKPGSVKVRISDSGAGISEQDLPHIFDRYFKSTTSAKQGGTGLGLAIVKRIVELHGSSIQVESRENEGTHFSFDLPVSKVA